MIQHGLILRHLVVFFGHWIHGFLICAVSLALLSAGSIIAHDNQSKIRDHIIEGLTGIESGLTSKNAFTDCIILSGVIAPVSSTMQYITSPKVNLDAPCDGLNEALAGGNTEWENYDRYWLGTIYLATIGLSMFDISTLQNIYKFLFIISVVCFGISGFRKLNYDLRAPVVIVSLGIFAGVGITSFANQICDSPTYFLPLFVFAAFLAFPSVPFDAGKSAWLGSIFGTITGYFDILSGGIPFTLALSIFVYYILWENGTPFKRSHYELFISIGTLSLSYFLSVISLVSMKLFVVTVILGHSDAVAGFKIQLMLRISDASVGGTGLESIMIVFNKLLIENQNAFFFGSNGSIIVYCLGAISWLVALAGATRHYVASRDFDQIIRFVAPLLAALVIPAWFIMFLNHGFIHAWFMTRVLCLVPTFGIAALWMVFSQKNSCRPILDSV